MSEQNDMFPGELGTALRDEAMARAGDHAGKQWLANARLALADFISAHTGDFTTEEVRVWATWVEEPPDRRAWGSVTAWAAKAGLIRRVGYRQHQDPIRHRGISTVWRKR